MPHLTCVLPLQCHVQYFHVGIPHIRTSTVDVSFFCCCFFCLFFLFSMYCLPFFAASPCFRFCRDRLCVPLVDPCIMLGCTVSVGGFFLVHSSFVPRGQDGGHAGPSQLNAVLPTGSVHSVLGTLASSPPPFVVVSAHAFFFHLPVFYYHSLLSAPCHLFSSSSINKNSERGGGGGRGRVCPAKEGLAGMKACSLCQPVETSIAFSSGPLGLHGIAWKRNRFSRPDASYV